MFRIAAIDGFEIAGLEPVFFEATDAIGRCAEGIVAAEQNLRYRHIGEERGQRRPVRLERDVVMELAQFMINAIRHFLGELPPQSHHRSASGEYRNGSAGVAEDEAYVWEARERTGEQKAEDAAVRILREFEQRG